MLIVRHIQTQPKREKGKLVRREDGTPVVEPVLDANGQEVELWRVEVPTEVEHQEREDPGAIDAYVAQELARRDLVPQETADTTTDTTTDTTDPSTDRAEAPV